MMRSMAVFNKEEGGEGEGGVSVCVSKRVTRESGATWSSGEGSALGLHANRTPSPPKSSSGGADDGVVAGGGGGASTAAQILSRGRAMLQSTALAALDAAPGAEQGMLRLYSHMHCVAVLC